MKLFPFPSHKGQTSKLPTFPHFHYAEYLFKCKIKSAKMHFSDE
ncbi:hypothetical protein J576_1556 [Acinetobacter sp. 766875]|nr:hypothetical protein ACIN5021_0836 [Acinetobacter sp. OIFC021]EXE50846.1 hypothetical protein J576_1556 [Acinetobacter sp. 766875]EXE78502.1 hypothetical protein J582_1121 [Acinetobacter sp. 1566109]EXR27039.1 hypothetical protein J694_2890 [Acinetobacter sp. 1281984]